MGVSVIPKTRQLAIFQSRVVLMDAQHCFNRIAKVIKNREMETILEELTATQILLYQKFSLGWIRLLFVTGRLVLA